MDQANGMYGNGGQPKRWGTAKRWCVVLMTGEDDCDTYPLHHCIMAVYGPYTRAKAESVFSVQPSWTAPHIMSLDVREDD